MLGAHGYSVWRLAKSLLVIDDRLVRLVEMDKRNPIGPMDGEARADLKAILDDPGNTLVGIDMPLVGDQLLRLQRMLDAGSPWNDVLYGFRDLRNRLEDHLRAIVLLTLDPRRAHLHDAKQLFGDLVEQAFPKAIDDIEDAGKCLAVGQGTATVMHLMRVMEAALKELAAMLGIPYAPSWESYLNQINAKISARHKTKAVRWKRDEPFFRDLAGDLLTVKLAWRNPTMHVVRRYSADEAHEIFVAVRTFCQRLAGHVGAKAKRPVPALPAPEPGAAGS